MQPGVAGIIVFLIVVFISVLAGRYLSDKTFPVRGSAMRRLREVAGESEEDEPVEQEVRLHAFLSALGGIILPGEGRRSANLGVQLTLAGYTHPSATLYFTACRLLLVIAVALIVGFTAAMLGTTLLRTFACVGIGGAIGYLLPFFFLSSRVKKRRRLIRNALPDALDIMVLCVESGASVNAAVQWITEEIQHVHPLLGAEMLIVHREIQLGLSASDAFRRFADRSGIEELRDLTSAFLQTERYGASIAKALRTCAEGARQDRQVWAEEVAQKAAVKILFPMLLCIFPAMFIVLLGPAAMQMSNLFAR